MKQCYFTLFLIFFISCKQETNAVNTTNVGVLSIFETAKFKIDTLQLIAFKSKELLSFYKNNNLETVWQSDDYRKIIIAQIKNASKDGLEPNDYAFEKLSLLEEKHNDLSDNELITYDVLLSNSVINLMQHLYKGKLNPRKEYPDWDLKEKEFDVNTLLNDAIKNNDFENTFKKCLPIQPKYFELKNALAIIDALPEDYSKLIDFSAKNKVKPNDKKKVIIDIKKRLQYWQYLPKNDTINNVYDTKTIKAVKEFQEDHGLANDGIIGLGTIRSLNAYKSERREQIIANMERWRWFPNEFGTHYTIVNLPEYSLKIVKNDTVQKEFKVIVGTDKRKSPVLSSKLNYVIFNPTWTVPPTIIKEDLIPDATKSRSYFSKMKIKIFKGKKEINPWQWHPDDANKYSYVQEPGDNNSLGLMKIIFNNKFSVYLHDTNHKTGFSSNYRSLSSGCTRVENPMELAKYVLNDTISWSQEKIDTLIKTRKTTPVKIKQDILHYQLYYTVWSQKNRVIYRNDMYNYDADLYCRLRK